MGQAFDQDGNLLGTAEGDSRDEVLKKLEANHRDAAEIRIQQLIAKVRELETVEGKCGDRNITTDDVRAAIAAAIDAKS